MILTRMKPTPASFIALAILFQNCDHVTSFSSNNPVNTYSNHHHHDGILGSNLRIPMTHSSHSILFANKKRKDDEDLEEKEETDTERDRRKEAPKKSNFSSSSWNRFNQVLSASQNSINNNAGEPDTFVTGKALEDLRTDMQTLKHNLEWAKALKDYSRIDSLTRAIRKGEQRDPGYMYDKAYRLIEHAKGMKDATDEEKDTLIEKWNGVSERAKEVLPQFQMEGLWVGK